MGDFGLKIEDVLTVNKDKQFQEVRAMDLENDLLSVYENGKKRGMTTGIPELDEIFLWRQKGGLYCVSGYEQSGKSEFTKYVSLNYCQLYSKKCVLFSPEEDSGDIYEDLARQYLGKNVNPEFGATCSKAEFQEAIGWIDSNYLILEFDGMVNFEVLLDEYSRYAEDGYGIFITDPFNYVAEGAFESDGGIKYLKVALSHMKTFSKRHGVQNIVVEHQNQIKVSPDGSAQRANKFNITGGSMWRNKPDCIVLIHSNFDGSNNDFSVDIEVAKQKRQRYFGVKGTRTVFFDIKTGRYVGHNPDMSFPVINEEIF